MNYLKCSLKISLPAVLLAVTAFMPVLAQQKTSMADTTGLSALTRAIEQQPDNDSLYCARGYFYIGMSRWNEAEEEFSRSIGLNDMNERAYNGLGLALFSKGENPFVPIEKLKQLLKVDNYSKAERAFQRALELNPEYTDARYNLACNYLMKEGADNYLQAVDHFKRILTRDPDYRDTEYMLGIAYMHAGDRYNAEKVFRESIDHERSAARARIKLSEILMETGRAEEAMITYYRGLEQLRDKKMIDEMVAEIEILLEKDEKQEIEDAPYEQKCLLIKKFWKKKDPTPTTPLNERFNVHFERVKIARNNYPMLIPPYFDDRGKIYVKYGEPDARYMSEIYEEMIKPNESWSYEHSLGEGMVFDFVQEGHSYWEVTTLQDAFHAGVNRDAYELYKERAYLSPAYQRLGISPDESKMIDFKAKKSLAHQRAPAENSEFKIKGNVLPFYYNFARFRSTDTNVRMEIYLGVPRRQLRFEEDRVGKKSTLNYTLLLQDSSYTDIKRIRKTFPIVAGPDEDVTGGVFLYQENVTLPPGEYHMAIRCENPEGTSYNVFKHDLQLDDYTGSDMNVSDLELASSITMASGSDTFVKNGLQIIPMPINIVSKRSAVAVYFEIYNLGFNAGGVSDYTVSYRVATVDEDKSAISKTLSAIGSLFGGGRGAGVSSSYRNSSADIATHEFITFDLKNMPPGIVDLDITVKDNVLNTEVSRTLSLRLTE
ncbi:GWxTD domain-containing protein [bacterium]|nr:GWxTD domain-containing protein [bacterium]